MGEQGGTVRRDRRHVNGAGPIAAMVFLVALNLRPAIVAVGPLLQDLGDDLGWSEGAQGMLGALPLLAFAVMSTLVRFLTARFGEDVAVLLALLCIAAGTVIRSAGGSATVWLGTLVIGCAIAVGNVLVPVIVKRDYPKHVSVVTSISSACITAGSATASLTAATMAQHWGGWRSALAFWAVPAVVVAALWVIRIVIHRRAVESTRVRTEDSSSNAVRFSAGDEKDSQDDVPLWRRPMTWWVTAFMGLQSAAFYTMSNWLPSIAMSVGFDSGAASRQLFVFQVIGVFSGLLITRLMNVRGNQITAAVVASLPVAAAGFGWLIAPESSMLWSVIAGCGQGAALVVALALIAMRGRTPGETVALSGIAQSVGYLLASAGPSVFGVLAEHTGGFHASLAFFIALAIIQCAIAVRVGRA